MYPKSILLLVAVVSSSYVPPYYEGHPTSALVASLDPPDYRGEDVYRIQFNLDAEPEMPQDGFVHRSWGDFTKFDRLLTTHILNFGLDFPNEPSVENLDAYIKRVMQHPNIVNSNFYKTFLESTGQEVT